MPVSWPPELPPTPLISGWADSLADGRTLPKTTLGVGKRRAFWSGVRKLTVSYNMTQTQYNILSLFWEFDTRHGVDPFYWSQNPVTAGLLLDDDGIPVTDELGHPLTDAVYQLVQFGQSPPRRSQAYTGDLFKVDIDIEILP